MGDYFCGWYIKCQNEEQTAAFILCRNRIAGKMSCSVQVITDDGAWNIPFDYAAYRESEEGVSFADSRFLKSGMELDLQGEGIAVTGKVDFGPFDPIRYDIMGPFKYVPFMQCRHSVFSMKHSVNGKLVINGRDYVFDDGVCYIEGDRGYSFPSVYVWTQCCFPEGSVMLSVADIPFCGFHFTGIISAIHYRGKEYRLGTYLGARAVTIRDGTVVIRQGRKQLTVKRLEKKGLPLAAPVGGDMTRTIHESAACRAYFHYQENGKTVFEFESGKAAFEYEYPH